MFLPADVTWSKVPVIVTFGAGGPAGACAKTGSAGIAKMTKASTAVRTPLLIAPSSGVARSNIRAPPWVNFAVSARIAIHGPGSTKNRRRGIECRDSRVGQTRRPTTSDDAAEEAPVWGGPRGWCSPIAGLGLSGPASPTSVFGRAALRDTPSDWRRHRRRNVLVRPRSRNTIIGRDDKIRHLKQS